MERMIRITSRPDGEAPEWVRDAWINLELPVTQSRAGSIDAVLTGKWKVNFQVAVQILGVKNPDARQWWERNANPRSSLVFNDRCCELLHETVLV